jgi:hypothetical protein
MSIKKATTNNTLQLWWGFGLQLNTLVNPASNSVITQYLILKGQDFSDSTKLLNFQCKTSVQQNGKQTKTGVI